MILNLRLSFLFYYYDDHTDHITLASYQYKNNSCYTQSINKLYISIKNQIYFYQLTKNYSYLQVYKLIIMEKNIKEIMKSSLK